MRSKLNLDLLNINLLMKKKQKSGVLALQSSAKILVSSMS